MAGPDPGSTQPKGLVWLALEVEAHCLRPEGFFPEKITSLNAFGLVSYWLAIAELGVQL